MKTRPSDRQARYGGLAGIAFALLGISNAQASALDEFVRLQVGSFSSEAHAKQDARYDAIKGRGGVDQTAYALLSDLVAVAASFAPARRLTARR